MARLATAIPSHVGKPERAKASLPAIVATVALPPDAPVVVVAAAPLLDVAEPTESSTVVVAVVAVGADTTGTVDDPVPADGVVPVGPAATDAVVVDAPTGAVVLVPPSASVVVVVPLAEAAVVVVVTPVAAAVVVVTGAVVLVVVVTGAVMLVVVAAGAAVLVVVGAAVVVVAGRVEVVETAVVLVVIGTHEAGLTVFVSRVVAPLRASRRPWTRALVFALIEVNAMIVPTNVDPTPSVAELPTTQNTLHAWAPLTRDTVLLGAVIRVDAAWKMKTAPASPWASRVSVPPRASDDGEL